MIVTRKMLSAPRITWTLLIAPKVISPNLFPRGKQILLTATNTSVGGTCCYKGKHKWQANKSRLGRDWSRQVMVSAEWSWQLAQDLFNPKIGFAPSANSDFFAQISLSTCSWVFRSHIFYFIIIFAQREHKVWDLRANKLDPTGAGGESAMLNAANAGFAHSPDWICAQLPIWISPPTVTRPPFLFVCLPAVCRVVNLLLVSCLRNQIRLMRRSLPVEYLGSIFSDMEQQLYE